MPCKALPLFALLACVLFACGGNASEETESSQAEPAPEVPLTLVEKGTYVLPIDEEADYQRLQNLKSFKLGDQEHLTFFDNNSRNIYLYDLATDSIINKIKLAREGPDAVKNMFYIDYFFHSLDSIFINTGRYGVYLLNDKARVLATAGAQTGNFRLERKNLVLDAASYYDQGIVYGATRTSVPSIAEDFGPSRGSINLETGDRGWIGPETPQFLPEYDEFTEIWSKSKRDKTMLTPLRREFVRWQGKLLATTPISDTITVFDGTAAQKKIYVGHPDYPLAPMDEYMYYRQIVNEPGNVSTRSELDQKPTFAGMFLSPDEQYLYRILVTSTKPVFYENVGYETPKVASAVLVACELATGKLAYLDLPVDSVDLWLFNSTSVFTSNRGIHIRQSDQEDEDAVTFQVFGFENQE